VVLVNEQEHGGFQEDNAGFGGWLIRRKDMKTICMFAVVAVMFAGCSDATRSRLGAYGEGGTVKCYSGGKLIFEGQSTGKIEANNSGFDFRDAKTGKLIRAYGDCIVEN